MSSPNDTQSDRNIQDCSKSPDTFHDKHMKKVRFMEPVDKSLAEESPRHEDDFKTEQWPLISNFNTIKEHELDMEYVPEVDADMKEEQEDSWPLFGDSITIMKHKSDGKNVKKMEKDMNKRDDSREKVTSLSY